MEMSQLSRTSTGSHDRKLRYRALLEDLSTLEDEANNLERIERTATAVREASALLVAGGVKERVRHPGEGYLDSRVLRATSDLAIRCSEAISGNANVYDRHQLALHMRENPDFWELMFPREIPTVAFLHGTFAPTPPEQRPRAPRRRVERQQAAALRAPASVDKLEKKDEGSEMVSRILRFLTKTYKRQNTPLSYFPVVLDPTSFTRTVENIYHVSFLARDGLVDVRIDEASGVPVIKPVPAAKQETRKIGGEKQFVVSLDKPTWRAFIDAFHITEPMMVLKRD